MLGNIANSALPVPELMDVKSPAWRVDARLLAGAPILVSRI